MEKQGPIVGKRTKNDGHLEWLLSDSLFCDPTWIPIIHKTSQNQSQIRCCSLNSQKIALEKLPHPRAIWVSVKLEIWSVESEIAKPRNIPADPLGNLGQTPRKEFLFAASFMVILDADYIILNLGCASQKSLNQNGACCSYQGVSIRVGYPNVMVLSGIYYGMLWFSMILM